MRTRIEIENGGIVSIEKTAQANVSTSVAKLREPGVQVTSVERSQVTETTDGGSAPQGAIISEGPMEELNRKQYNMLGVSAGKAPTEHELKETQIAEKAISVLVERDVRIIDAGAAPQQLFVEEIVLPDVRASELPSEGIKKQKLKEKSHSLPR